MRKEKNYDFRKRLLEVHQTGKRDFERKIQDNELWFTDGDRISISENAGAVVRKAAEDFAGFMRVSMSVATDVVTAGAALLKIKIAQTPEDYEALGEMACYRGFVCEVSKDGVRVLANDERGAAQALYYIEDMMCFERAPVLKFGRTEKKPLYSPQMIHSGYGMDEYPDEYLSRVAHEGRDAILIFTKDVNQTPSGYLDFNDLINRAAGYGLDVYAYSYIISDMNPEQPEAEAYYENTYGRLFRECPGLKGVTLVGESVEFPSKDPHISPGRMNQTAVDGIPTGKVTAGWYPCEDYPVWINLMKKIIRKYKPDADIVFWTYNWGFQPEEARIRLIENLPDDISLQATFEMFEPRVYENTVGRCEDYTLSFSGPGAYFESEAAAAKKRNIRLYSMTNSGGLTWDFGVIPYEPMPFAWIKRYAEMEKAHDRWGLCGLMESHHYGFYPSFISKLSKHLFMQPHEPAEVILNKIIKSEFGAENCDTVTVALRLWSDAINFYTPSDGDQYGAFRVGPSYPFNLSEVLELPGDPGAVHGNCICDMTYRNVSDHRLSHLSLRIHDELKMQKKMLSLIEEGVSELEKISEPNESLVDLINMGLFMRNTVITGIHAKEWYILKHKMYASDNRDELVRILDEMEKLLKEEIKNAEATIPLAEHDSRLGWEPSMLYMTDRRHLEWKIRQVRYVLESDLKKHRQSLITLNKKIRN